MLREFNRSLRELSQNLKTVLFGYVSLGVFGIDFGERVLRQKNMKTENSFFELTKKLPIGL